MATQVRHPIWLAAVPAPGARTFATLYAFESFARASVSSVIPITAYDILQDKQHVSLLYTLVAMIGLSITLLMPVLIEKLARRWVYTLGACCLMLGAVLLMTGTLSGQIGGMLARVIGASALQITTNLYIMDYIRKTEFMRSESLRMAMSTFAWTGGPTLGVVVYSHFGVVAAQGLVVVFALILLVLFWYYRLSDNAAIRAGRFKASNPLKNIGRFAAQPRMRLAWLIAFGRSCFWSTFFVYGPIFMIVTGQGELAGGLLVSAGNVLLFSALAWGWIGRRFGARNTIGTAFLAIMGFLLLAGAAGEARPLLAAGCLVAAALFCIALDALGSTAFFRAVRPLERAEMTAIYRTYLDFSELLPPLVYTGVLQFFGLGGVFATLGLFAGFCGIFVWLYLPRSL